MTESNNIRSTVPQTEQSNKYHWTTHQVPRSVAPANYAKQDETLEEEEAIPPPTYVIRTLKQGTTGARKTWEAAEVLLEYLVRRGGMRDMNDKIPGRGGSEDKLDVLDMTLPPGNSTEHPGLSSGDNVHTGAEYNIVEIGAGTGCLGVGLSMALNSDDNNEEFSGSGQSHSTAKLLCTDVDKATIKNMRYNISEQPRANKISKNVRVETLGWADDAGGEKFTKAVGRQFEGRGTDEMKEADDPMRLVTHLIGSDVHFGCHTLQPLSSVISAFKLRNPDVNVVVLMKERNPEQYADIAELALVIEEKVKKGLGLEEHKDVQSELNDFSVSVRDILHNEFTNMKLMEC